MDHNGYISYTETCDTEALASHLADQWVADLADTEDYKRGRIFVTWVGAQAILKIRKDSTDDYELERTPWGGARVLVKRAPDKAYPLEPWHSSGSEEAASYFGAVTYFVND